MSPSPDDIETGAAVTRANALPRRLWAYLRERYDPFQFGPFYLLLTAAVLGLCHLRYGVPWAAGIVLRGGVLAGWLFAFYLLLRVFDEHKDRATDRLHFPERVLSRGLVTLGHLRAVGVGCVLYLLAAGFWLGPPVLVLTLLTLGYALLMLREFFVGAWLRRHLWLYGLTHNVVVFLTMHVCFLGFGRAVGVQTYQDPAVHGAALALNALFFSLEVARKIRMPAREVEGIDTYSQVVGYRRATGLVAVVQAAGLGLLGASGWAVGWGAWAAMGGVYALMAGALVRFLRHPTPAGAEALIKPASFAFLGYLVVLIAAAL